ncbi:TLC domain-containing protein 1-like [Electrophorus electricus]|uniref:TLC domain-containing protein n=1 Tax=Electrophorus electricus TaxID=8005 RepID=A0A4W4E5R7_ELEEL|nr:TLC domain-containing protein 1-like [Electrophorus electricus]
MEGTWLRLHSHPALSVVAFALVFRAVHRLLYSLTPPPRVVERNPLCAWKWRNLCLSLAHSLVTGPWAATCVIVCPEMLKDLHSYSTPISYLLICVSSGYFVQDTGDIIFSGHAKGSWEFLLHHFLVLWCFLYALYTRRYVGGAVIALLVEINSVTLHTRLLLKLAEARASTVYRINKLLNLLTYVTFRLGTQFYLTWYLLWNYSWLDHAAYFLGTVLLMDIIILIYFYRLLRADFFPSGYARLERNATSSNGFSDFLKD